MQEFENSRIGELSNLEPANPRTSNRRTRELSNPRT